MNKTFRSIITGGVIVLFLTVMLPCASGKDRVFTGKVVDAETKAAIEGMIVVAYWMNPKGKPIVKEIKETLTNENGEWSIIGEEGEGKSLHPFPSIFQQDHYGMKQPEFIIFKPGHESYSSAKEGSYTFVAYQYLDKKLALEGIILSIDKKEVDYLRKITSKDPIGTITPIKYGLPFIPIKDAENKLKKLEIPFDYDPFNVKRLYDLEDLYKKKNCLFYTYTLFGLKRLHKREDRAHALINPIFEYFDDEPEKERELLRKQKNFLRLFVDESKYLGLNWHEMYIKKLGEN